MSDDSPATKKDLAELEQRIDAKLDALEQRIADRIASAIRESETRLLKAIYGLVDSVNKRLVGLEHSSSDVLNRISTLENRITEVEKRLNLPPAA